MNSYSLPQDKILLRIYLKPMCVIISTISVRVMPFFFAHRKWNVSELSVMS